MAYRDEVDWQRLLEEGGTVPLPDLNQVTALVAPLANGQNVLVVLMPCHRTTVEKLRLNLGNYLTMVKAMLQLAGLR